MKIEALNNKITMMLSDKFVTESNIELSVWAHIEYRKNSHLTDSIHVQIWNFHIYSKYEHVYEHLKNYGSSE